jgi:hypothetical protein
MKNLDIIRSFVFVLGCITSCGVFSGVYRCIDERGIVEFRDRACEPVGDVVNQEFLPYVYEPTDPNIVLEKEKSLQITQKKINALEKKQKRSDVQIQKQSAKEAAKTQRRLVRCENTGKKIGLIEDELRHGCKLRRANTLKKQLIHFEMMKQRYCTAS